MKSQSQQPKKDDRGERMLRGALLAFAASLPIAISPAQFFGFGALLIWAILRLRPGRPRNETPNPLAFPMACFIGWALIASALGERPAASFGRSHRYLMYLLPLAIPSAARRSPEGAPAFARRLVHAFLFGALCLGLYDVIQIPLNAARDTSVWLFSLGNMRDPQFHMTALLLLLSAGPRATAARVLPPVGERPRIFQRLHTPGALHPDRFALFATRTFLAAAGLILHFKRGVWFATLLALAVPTAAQRRWRSALVAGAAVLILLCAPPVRERLAGLRAEWDGRRGGRRELWTHIAPAMIREHPLGFGPRAIRHEDLRAYGRVEHGLSHLHNNVLQITAEFGWPGIAAWLAWMGLGAAALVRTQKSWPRGSTEWRMAVGLLAAYTGLHVNGLVEYNFGTSEILMLYMLLLGIALSLRNPPDRPGR